jgi:hypothetical protein
MVVLGPNFAQRENSWKYYTRGACDVQQVISEMHMTVHALKKKQKRSSAQKSRVSGPDPESPENPETPGKSPDSPRLLIISENSNQQ